MQAATKWIIGGIAAAGALLYLKSRRSESSSSALVSPGPLEVVGDSLAVGLAPSLKASSKLKSAGVTPVTGWGVGGSIAAMWTQQIEAVLSTKPKTVLVSLGTNDSVSPNALAAFPARIKTIADKIRAAGATPVLLASPAKLPNIGQTNAALSATGALVLVPRAGLAMQPDNVHPTPAGYKMWADDIAEAIT
jgi:lysophospholipase L1-like esterase